MCPHHANRRGDEKPAVFDDGPRPVANHIFNVIVETLGTCRRQQGWDPSLPPGKKDSRVCVSRVLLQHCLGAIASASSSLLQEPQHSQRSGQGAPQECGQLWSLSWTNFLSSQHSSVGQQGQPLSISKARTSAQVLPISGDCQDCERGFSKCLSLKPSEHRLRKDFSDSSNSPGREHLKSRST